MPMTHQKIYKVFNTVKNLHKLCLLPWPNTNEITNTYRNTSKSYKDQIVYPRQWKYVFKKVQNLLLDCLSGALPKYQWPFRISPPPFSFYYGSNQGCVFAHKRYFFLKFCSTFHMLLVPLCTWYISHITQSSTSQQIKPPHTGYGKVFPVN